MDRADRDPVEVEADALMDAVTGHVQQALRDYGIADETIANDPEIASSTKEALGTAIATALRTAEARGAEGMREAVLADLSAYIRRAEGQIAAARPGTTGLALLEERVMALDAARSRVANIALPLSDAPASPWPKVKAPAAGDIAWAKVRIDTDPSDDGWCFCTPANPPEDVARGLKEEWEESSQFYGQVIVLDLPTPPAKDETA